MNNNLLTISLDNNEEKVVTVNHVYCIGYAGRDMDKVMEHVIELEKIGVPRPPEIPTLYPVRRNSLNQSNEIEVLGNDSSGEAEIVLIFDEVGEVFITLGSDHTDRSLETTDINKSKQVCDKPIAKNAWKLIDVINHWDSLILNSEVFLDGEWIKYQTAKLDEIIPFEEIKNFLNKKNVPLKNSVYFSGTVPLLDGFKYGTGFKMSFIDPVKNEEIHAEYKISRLDIDGVEE